MWPNFGNIEQAIISNSCDLNIEIASINAYLIIVLGYSSEYQIKPFRF